jgi:hypothetical protein
MSPELSFRWQGLVTTNYDVGGTDKVGQWSDGVVPLRGGVKTGHWLG